MAHISKKHYKLVATVLRDKLHHDPELLLDVATAMGHVFQSFNIRFDLDSFVNDCLDVGSMTNGTTNNI